MNKTVRIPSRLYRALFEQGGDRLVAVFCMLKTAKGDSIKFHSFTSNNKKRVSGYALLRNKSNISLSTLKSYCQILSEMSLLNIEVNGDVTLISNNSAKKDFQYKNKIKLVPILIGKNLIETSYNSMMVRLHSDIKQQERMIEKKQRRSVLLNSNTKRRGLTRLKRYSEKIVLTSEVVLSNMGYAKLLQREVNERLTSITKSKGAYYKKKFKQKELISTKRRFEYLFPLSFDEYVIGKQNNLFEIGCVYADGCLARPLVSSIKITL